MHFEIELVTEVWKFPNGEHIHYHRTPEGRNFVCWTRHVPTLKAAEELFRMWCVGTTYTIVHGKDFAALHKDNFDEFIEDMALHDIALA